MDSLERFLINLNLMNSRAGELLIQADCFEMPGVAGRGVRVNHSNSTAQLSEMK